MGWDEFCSVLCWGFPSYDARILEMREWDVVFLPAAGAVYYICRISFSVPASLALDQGKCTKGEVR